MNESTNAQPRKQEYDMAEKINVTVWNEFRHEKSEGVVKNIYPNGIHAAIGEGLESSGKVKVRTATLDDPEHGLTEDVLRTTDVLTWWSHVADHEVRDEVVDQVQRHVLEGMGLIVLHSGLCSKIFRHMMGTSCTQRWRDVGERERLWNVAPRHPITEGVGECIVLPQEEMYGEQFDIPEPDQLVFIGWFQGGEVFRSGCCWERGHGRIFYFQPGHETYPIYHNPEIIRILVNAVCWAKPQFRRVRNFKHIDTSPEPIEKQ